jgi:hypothetical protein
MAAFKCAAILLYFITLPLVPRILSPLLAFIVIETLSLLLYNEKAER